MKRLSLGLFAVALVALAGCSSSTPSRSINGQLSANTHTLATRKSTTTTRKHHPTTTTRRDRTSTTKRDRTSTSNGPTVPTTLTTISATGVAGAVLYEKNCSADRPCSFDPGPAQLRLLDSHGVVVARGNAANNGSFYLQAAPGSYTLEAKPPSKKQVCGSVSVTVTDQGYTPVQVQCGDK
ncbi:MAG TPA: hypothetical protein VFB78_09700 [Acidimicrobiales bacterium]|nr:hypothetical protein [Acidimicrobiales bacterium]